MKGHIRKRGERSWELKFDIGVDPATGKRRVRYHSFRGTKREAEIELAKLVTANAKGEYVDPSKMTVAQFVDRWRRDWAESNVSPKTLERYLELLRNHVCTRIGNMPLQKVRPVNLAELYARLMRDGRGDKGGLAARTVGHVHRVLHRALGRAAWSPLLTAHFGMMAGNIDELFNLIEVELPKIEAANKDLIGIGIGTLTIGGWSEARQEMRLAIIHGEASAGFAREAEETDLQGAIVGDLYALHVREGEDLILGPPVPDDLWQEAIGPFYASLADVPPNAQFAKMILTVQRHAPAKFASGRVGCIVGGFGQMTTIKPAGIEMAIIDRYPDEIGEYMTPAPIDWAAFRAANVATTTAGMSRLQREAFERRQRKLKRRAA